MGGLLGGVVVAVGEGRGVESKGRSVRQQLVDRCDEFSGAFDEFGGFLRACWCGLIVTFLVGAFGAGRGR